MDKIQYDNSSKREGVYLMLLTCLLIVLGSNYITYAWVSEDKEFDRSKTTWQINGDNKIMFCLHEDIGSCSVMPEQEIYDMLMVNEEK